MNNWGRVPEDKYREATCAECGCEYYRHYTNTKSRFCPTCQEQRKIDRSKESYVQHDIIAGSHRFTDNRVWTVVKTPCKDFKVGSKFYKEEIAIGKTMMIWPLGMVFENEGKRIEI